MTMLTDIRTHIHLPSSNTMTRNAAPSASPC